MIDKTFKFLSKKLPRFVPPGGTARGEQANKLMPRAFTLIELLIYIVVIGGVAVTFISYSLSVAGVRNKTYVAQEVQANARIAVEIISQRIKAATGVNAGDSVFDSSPGRLSLVMADVLKNPTVIDVDANGAIQISEGASQPVSITGSRVEATNLVFRNYGGGNARENIGVEITVAYKNDSNDVEYNYSQSLRMAVSVRQ
ncbi:hypothetical protein A3H10_03605 [Candidatus Uhrbacteria bacterium RIFCSPLOWO2_12_FULL_46_10]|uniref:Prepilin-type N-terminal cleavage/methylation domain-containing protein n=1 Tax=Candidatus Uhrbacteria bacterium RIFCSPLOWO2_01_FULL_47_25 TaxID=1802402 RepID=A0A1F7UX09_9BACT|nr:MAG: hypothetical protein UX68_C0011G0034 [Parcubacteria group bacterium GW2011_GWA2_46_9]OGL59073.1 MAG: hypothetical protein A2752_02560 [Candidatus Uhrbacteria bacterium RIFCSPHIGHO2_01_FULL_46_23]OGL68740.1 MAG: hypothetical protein A3D60_02165 [Candidatus Uhrbacteria bacterium RIFCSPHIGHO2_02_FULL_47_29]OGL74766.1 MAG: hypothetical protein A3E96_03450 [Candidatus Uhrbacteria bacterium RIFCSPHIGHO2_12_FULL_46_13]OGL82177.1 MAG: hypothetical protein A2936_01280 [Candidatus Uhrbacteria bac